MFLLKGCPRCTGDLYMDRNDEAGPELYCIQCGFRSYPEVLAPRLEAATRAEKRTLAGVA